MTQVSSYQNSNANFLLMFTKDTDAEFDSKVRISSWFKKLPYFESNPKKKNCKESQKISFFQLKIHFRRCIFFLKEKIGLTLILLNEIFLMVKSQFEISHSVLSYVIFFAENCRFFYDAEKRIISNISKITISNYDSAFLRLKSIVSKFNVPTLYIFRDMSS